MTLPSSGPISWSQIATELGTSLPLTIPSQSTRDLAGKQTGALVVPTDFHGKSFKQFAFLNSYGWGSGSQSGVDFGGAASGRRIFLTLGYLTSGSIHPTYSLSSVTIGGVTATIHAHSSRTFEGLGNEANPHRRVGAVVCSAVVPTGTSGTVTPSYSGSGTLFSSSQTIGSFRMVGATGTSAHATAAANQGSSSATVSSTIDIPDNGILLFAGAVADASISSTTGTASEAYNTGARTGRYETEMSAQTARPISMTVNDTNSGKAIAAVSWEF